MTSQLATVPLEKIIADEDAWPRRGWDDSRVAEFMDLFRDGGLDALPPLDVVPDGDQLILADGWHRYAALDELGSEQARVQILPACDDPAEAAYRHGLLTAATTALPLTREERREAVLRLLERSPELADREIARLTGVSPSTVGAHRRRLAQFESTVEAGQAEPGAVYLAELDAQRLAAQLARSLDKLWEARGLRDMALSDRTGKRLAAALRERHGERALVWARRLAGWSATCLAELETVVDA